jgi:hypothetical protein
VAGFSRGKGKFCVTALAANIPENATLAVLIVDLERLLCIEGSASGFNGTNCTIVSPRVSELSETIGLRVDGVDMMIKGRIIDLLDGEAKVLFDFGDGKSSGEKRRERRRAVHIPAQVSDCGGAASFNCIISNASKNGCRLEGRGVDSLPDIISLRIAGLDLPVRGNIAWRGPDCVGVQLLWQFSNGKDMNPVLNGMGSGGSGNRKAVVDGFGRTRNDSGTAGQTAEQKRAARMERRIKAGAFGAGRPEKG